MTTPDIKRQMSGGIIAGGINMRRFGSLKKTRQNRTKLKQRKESLLSEKADKLTQLPSEQPEKQEAVIYHKNGKLMNIEGLKDDEKQ
jgi:uncharacterized membrane protein YgaE (UPF0421/DUF939 family)